MARQTILSEAIWHELRAKHIGASDVAALFGCGFQTHFELWHEKKGDLGHEDLSGKEGVVIGKHLQDGIMGASGELFGLELVKADVYATDDTTPGLGATPDCFLTRDGVEIPVEVKNASWGAWKDNWIVHEDGSVEPPLRYLLQVQTQIACLNAKEGMLIALISGDRIVKCDIPRHEESIAEIRRRVTAFWQSIAADQEPEAQLPQDLDAMKKVWGAGEASVDLSGDPDVEQWLSTLAELREGRKRFEHDIDVTEGHVLKFCVDNGFAAVKANGGRISVKTRPAKPERLVTYKASDARIEMRITPTKTGAGHESP